MHTITIDNYEAYLLDFSEGNLRSELQMELELFLIQHPELEIDLNELELVTLENETVSFSDKTDLKKHESDLISENQFIAYIENELTPTEKLFVEKSCAANPTLLKELKLYKNTIAKADATIVYDQKNNLKRKPKILWFDFSAAYYSIAACMVFLIGLFALWPIINPSKPDYQLATKIIVESSKKQDLIISKKIHTKNTAHYSSSVQNSTLLANTTSHILKNKYNSTNTHSVNAALTKDTLQNLAIISPTTQVKQNEELSAQNTLALANEKKQTVVDVITETDDDMPPLNSENNKKGIWATASRILKKLNHVGVKGVNSSENDTKNGSTYAYNLGGLNLTHKSGL